jgi:RHS repeat-associated protein
MPRLRTLTATFVSLAIICTALTTGGPSTGDAVASTPPDLSLVAQASGSDPTLDVVNGGRSSISADGRFVAYVEERPISGSWFSSTVEEVVVWDVAANERRLAHPFPTGTWAVYTANTTKVEAMSPNGKWILATAGVEGRKVDGKTLLLIPNPFFTGSESVVGVTAESYTGPGFAADVSDSGHVVVSTPRSHLVSQDPSEGSGNHVDVYLWTPPAGTAPATVELLTAGSGGTALGTARQSVAIGNEIAAGETHPPVFAVVYGNGLDSSASSSQNHLFRFDSDGPHRIASGRQSAADSIDVSQNGRFVVAQNSSSHVSWFDLDPDNNGDFTDTAPTTTQVNPSGVAGGPPTISDDGGLVVWFSAGTGITPPEFVYARSVDRLTATPGLLRLVNRQHDDLDDRAVGRVHRRPMVSGDGRTVVFASSSNELIPGDTSTDRDVFVWWRFGSPPSTARPVHLFQTRFGERTNPTGEVGDPVNSLTGAFVDSTVDVPGSSPGVDLALERSYSSDATLAGSMGPGWAHNFELRLVDGGERAAVWTTPNSYLVFTSNDDGTYSGPADALVTLVAAGAGWELRYPDGQTVSFDSSGHLSGIVDVSGRGLAVTTNPDGTPSEISDTAGRTAEFAYDDGLLTGVEFSDGRAVSYSYSGGLLTEFVDVRLHATAYSYVDGRLDTVTDPNDHVVVDNDYDANGRVASNVEAPGIEHFYKWDPSTTTMVWTDGRGNDWTDIYADGRLVTRVDPLGHETTFTYDTAGNRTSMTDQLEQTVTWTHDAAGRVLSQTGPDPAATVEWEWNADGTLAETTDPAGQTTTFSYTDGLLTRIDHPDATFETFTRDASTGAVLSHTNGAAETATFTVDAAGNTVTATSPEGRTTSFTYDVAGRVTSKVDPRGNLPGADPDDFRSEFTYDAAGNPLTVTTPEGRTTSFTYDDVGNRLTAEMGSDERAWTYDEGNWPTQVTVGDDATAWSYDNAGNLADRAEPEGTSSTWSYDEANRVTEFEQAASGATSLTVDELGRTSSLVAANGTSGVAAPSSGIDYSYDLAGRVAEADFDDPATADVSSTYDLRGLRTTLTDATGTRGYAYDERGRMLTATHDADGGGPGSPVTEFSYSYDDAGRLESRTHGGRTTTYSYDGDGHVTGISDGVNEALYTYDAAGNLASIESPNGATEARTCDRDSRLESQVVTDATTAVIIDRSFTYDAQSRVSRIDDTAPAAATPTLTFTYDDAGRVISECRAADCTSTPALRTDWTYDDAGRRLSQTDASGTTTYTYDSTSKRLTSTSGPAGTTTYTYDNEGNRVSMGTSAGTTLYSYDAAGRLVELDGPEGIFTFSYDGFGNRVAASGPTGSAVTFWDPNGSLASPVLVSTTSGTTTVDSELEWSPGGSVAWADVGGDLQVPHTDQVNSPLLVTGDTGEVTHEFLDDVWGVGTVSTVDVTAPAPVVGFSSTITALAAPGLTHMRARDYDPTVGAFTTTDPLDRAVGDPWVDAYAYTDGNPVQYWDPSGLRGEGGTCRAAFVTLPTAFSGNGGAGCKGGAVLIGEGCSYACWAATGTTFVVAAAAASIFSIGVCTASAGLGCPAAVVGSGAAAGALVETVRHATSKKTTDGLGCSVAAGALGGAAGGAAAHAVGSELVGAGVDTAVGGAAQGRCPR